MTLCCVCVCCCCIAYVEYCDCSLDKAVSTEKMLSGDKEHIARVKEIRVFNAILMDE